MLYLGVTREILPCVSYFGRQSLPFRLRLMKERENSVALKYNFNPYNILGIVFPFKFLEYFFGRMTHTFVEHSTFRTFDILDPGFLRSFTPFTVYSLPPPTSLFYFSRSLARLFLVRLTCVFQLIVYFKRVLFALSLARGLAS